MKANKNENTQFGMPIRLWARLADHASGATELGLTPLHVAAFNGSAQEVKKLLQEHADPNAIDKHGWTPLHDAAIQGHTEIVRLLLAADARVDAQDTEDLYTPLHDAVRMNYVEIAKLLLEHGADLSLKDRWQETPLDIAQKYNFNGITEVVSNKKK